MLEKRKEDSESVGKYQGILTSVVIAAIIIWVAPIIIPFITTGNLDGDIFDQTGLGTNGTGVVPTKIIDRVQDIWGFFIWVIRIVLVFAVMVSVTMLRYKK